MTDRRALALVCFVPIACWIACWPFVDMAVNDDWGYAWVVRRLLETGRIEYNGWIAPIVGVQALWGAAFAKVLGFSHDVLRLSTLPFAVACAALAYTFFRRLPVPPRWAAFATLLLVTSPLFTPWSASFMTEVPGLAFTLAIYNGVLMLARASDRRSAAIACAVVALAAIAGGSIRQTNFMFGAIPLAAELFRRRREPQRLPIAIALAATGIAGWLIVGWYRRQPFAVPELNPSSFSVTLAIQCMIALGLTLVFYVLPLALASLRTGRRKVSDLLPPALACVAVCLGSNWLLPDAWINNYLQSLWIGNTLTSTGLLFDSQDAPGLRPVLFGTTSRAATAAAVYFVLVLLAIAAWQQRAALGRLARDAATGRSSPAWHAIVAISLALAAYAAAIFPRAGLRVIFDRYLLVVIPIVAAAALLASRRRLLSAGPGRAAWALLAAYAALGCAITFDHFCELRARERIAADFAARGVPRTAFMNGFSFDGWTELLERGYVNNPQILNPPDAYRPLAQEEWRLRFQTFWFLPFVPSIRPEWIVYCAESRPAPSAGQTFTYRALLPPQERYLTVVRAPRNLRAITADSTTQPTTTTAPATYPAE